MKRFVIILILMISSQIIWAQHKIQTAVPYTLADRDRAIRTEVKVDSFDDKFAEMDKKFDAVNARIDRMEDKFTQLFMWGFGIVIMSILGLVGFILYDRRTTIAPVERKTEKILKSLREVAKEDKALRDALNKVALW